MPGTFVSRHSPISETCTLSLYLHILTFPGLSHSYLQLCHTKSSLLLLPPYHHCWLFHTPCTSSLLLMRTQSSLCILTSLTPSFLSQPLSRTAYSSWAFRSASYHTLHPLSSYFFTSSFNQSSSSSFYFPQPHSFTLFSHVLFFLCIASSDLSTMYFLFSYPYILGTPSSLLPLLSFSSTLNTL